MTVLLLNMLLVIYGVYHGRTKFILGASVQSRSERFGVTVDPSLENSNVVLVRISTIYVKEGSPVNIIRRFLATVELMVKHDVIYC